jgi:methyl-accepting chemotaxis protein
MGLLAVAGAVLFGRQFSRPIHALVDTTARIAEGDLGVEPPSSQTGELGLLAGAFEQMTSSLSALIRQVRNMSLSVGGAAGQVVMTQRQHAASAEEQAAAVSNASAAVMELASSSAQIATTSEEVVKAATRTRANAEQGARAMAEAARHLDRISESNQASLARVRDLGDLADRIGGVMGLIEDIAAQTKLIAFNASIEAATAGESGRRFGVVATQVRRLADRVAQSTEQIRAMVEEIQATTGDLVTASERERVEIESGMAVGQDMVHLLEEMLESAAQTALAVQQISESTQEQRQATEHLQSDLEPVTAGARSIANGSQETKVVMEDLVARAQELEQMVQRFKLPGMVE